MRARKNSHVFRMAAFYARHPRRVTRIFSGCHLPPTPDAVVLLGEALIHYEFVRNLEFVTLGFFRPDLPWAQAQAHDPLPIIRSRCGKQSDIRKHHGVRADRGDRIDEVASIA